MASSRVFLAHQSAFQYWAYHEVHETHKTSCSPAHKDAPSATLLEDASRFIIRQWGEVHVAVADDRSKRKIPNAQLHVRKVPYPSGSFYRIAPDVYVASPELCFLQAAQVLELVPLILYGFELCGTYARTGNLAHTRYQRQPLTSASKIKAYLAKSKGAAGIKRAQRASEYLVDGSASPRESMLTMMMSLPRLLGGFGMPKPQLNYAIKTNMLDPRKSGELLTLHGDIVWPKAHIIVEYDGPQHGQLDNHSLDKQRDHLLLDAGFETIRFTDDRIKKPEEIARLAATINKRAQLRRPKSSLETDRRKLDLQHQLLHDCDLPWLHYEEDYFLN